MYVYMYMYQYWTVPCVIITCDAIINFMYFSCPTTKMIINFYEEISQLLLWIWNDERFSFLIRSLGKNLSYQVKLSRKRNWEGLYGAFTTIRNGRQTKFIVYGHNNSCFAAWGWVVVIQISYCLFLFMAKNSLSDIIQHSQTSLGHRKNHLIIGSTGTTNHRLSPSNLVGCQLFNNSWAGG